MVESTGVVKSFVGRVRRILSDFDGFIKTKLGISELSEEEKGEYSGYGYECVLVTKEGVYGSSSTSDTPENKLSEKSMENILKYVQDSIKTI